MINKITMETVACLRSKCHLKQNLIPSWPWSFRHTCELQFQFPVQNKIHKQKFFSLPCDHDHNGKFLLHCKVILDLEYVYVYVTQAFNFCV
jgi:hypothetical protein